MSEERRWKYRLSEDEQRKIRINALKESIKGSISKWKTVVRRAEELGIRGILSNDEEWISLNKRINDLASQALFENNENRLYEIQQTIESNIGTASNLIRNAYEQELEKQRKEAALKNALSSLESLKTSFEAIQSNELVKKWESKKLAELLNKIKETEKLVEEEKYDKIPNRCETLKIQIADVPKEAKKKEEKYNEITSVKDKIQSVLTDLGFAVTFQERRENDEFIGYIITAEDFVGREVKTEIGADGKVKDTFNNFEGKDCLSTADDYAKFLYEKYGIKMEDVVEDPPREKPKIIYKDEMELPGGKNFEKGEV